MITLVDLEVVSFEVEKYPSHENVISHEIT